MNANSQQQRAPSQDFASRSYLAARGAAFIIGLALFFPGVANRMNAASSLKEHELKAAFIYNFTKFVEWPVGSFGDTNAPIVLGVAGDSPCKRELQQIATERKVNGRPLIIKTVNSPRDAKDVHMLFVAASEDSRLDEWLGAARGGAILTAGESPQFIKSGGMINLLLEGEKIRFEINMDSAEAAGLKISAQLQKLAKTIRRKP